MAVENISDVTRSAMNYERARAEVASYNLAVANVAIAPGDASPLLSVGAPTFANRVGLQQATVGPQHGIETRVELDPHHPLADKDGMVHYPKIEMAREMATLVSATRAYEANIRAYNTLRGMTLKAFEIGK